jgi:L-threonylcarbamoyladenylate synthase
MMHEILKLSGLGAANEAGQAALKCALELLKNGQCVAVPTETVYGLAADATSDKAVKAIYSAKGRPSHNPLIIHVDSIAMAQSLATIPDRALALMEQFWPGALTFVCDLKPEHPLALNALAGKNSVALRAPQGFLGSLIKAYGKPLAAPSANRSGHVSATKADHISDDLGDKVPLIVDGGSCLYGIESTILDMREDPPVLLRHGALSQNELEATLGCALARPDQTINNHNPVSPGQLSSHYAPKAALRLNATDVQPHEALLAFGLPLIEGAGACQGVAQLSEQSDVYQAAARLFESLRRLDKLNINTIAVMAIPDQGIGAALNDRLKRASAPKI